MERISGARAENRILHRLIRKAEASYTVSDISKAIGPMIDLMFVSLFIGVRGVTVIGYVSPLIMLFELIGTTLNSGSRNKVSALICAGQQEEANRAFSGSLIAGGGLSALAAVLTALFCSGVCVVLGARDPEWIWRNFASTGTTWSTALRTPAPGRLTTWRTDSGKRANGAA